MSFSRSDCSDRRELAKIQPVGVRRWVVDDALADVGDCKPRVLLRVAAARFRVPRTFRSKHSKRLIRGTSIGILGGCIAVVSPGSIRVVALYKPTVLTTTTSNGNHVVTVIIDGLKTIAVPCETLWRVEARTGAVRCGYTADISGAIVRGRKEKLTTWMRPLAGGVGIGMYQSCATHELVCMTCGETFQSYSDWQRHTGNEAVKQTALMAANQEDKLIHARMKPPDGPCVREPRSGVVRLDHEAVCNKLSNLIN